MDADPLISQSMDVGEDATAIRLVIKRAPSRAEQRGGVGTGAGEAHPGFIGRSYQPNDSNCKLLQITTGSFI